MTYVLFGFYLAMILCMRMCLLVVNNIVRSKDNIFISRARAIGIRIETSETLRRSLAHTYVRYFRISRLKSRLTLDLFRQVPRNRNQCA